MNTIRLFLRESTDDVEIKETKDPSLKRWHKRYDLNNKYGKNIGFIVVARQLSTPGDKNKDPGNNYTIQSLYIHPSMRGRGYITKLMNHVKEEFEGKTIYLRAHPYEEIKGKVQTMTVEKLKKIYRKYGFRKSIKYPDLMVRTF